MRPVSFASRPLALLAAAAITALGATSARAQSEGPRFSTAVAHSLWTNANAVQASDDVYATTSTDGASLELTNFGFAIPANAVVRGIEVQIERFKTGSANIRDLDLHVMQGGVTAGNDLALSGNWPETETVQTYGGPTGLWGLSWTPGLVNASNFGVHLIIEKIGGSSATANVDSISVTVYYDLPTPTPTPTPSQTETPTPTPSETETPTPTPSETETPTPTPSETETPTPTPSETETPTPTPSETETPTPTPSVSPSPTPDIVTLTSMNVQTGGNFGVSVAGIADFTGDAKGDLIIGAHTEKSPGGPDFAGRTYLFDGATGTSLTALVSPLLDRDGNAGRNVQGIADLNADGRNELLVASWQEEPLGGLEDAGRIHLYDGATRALIRTIDSPNAEIGGRFGARVSGGGDVNGDGKQDIVVGAPNEDVTTTGTLTDAGRTYVFSGATGALLRTYKSPTPKTGGLFGFFAALVYDLNNDVRGDIVVGAYKEDVFGANNAGRVHVFSGRQATPTLLYSLQSPNPNPAGEFGRNVARHFDLTGDARVDIVVGAPFEEAAGNPLNSGLVHIYRGSDGVYLRTLQSPYPNAFGRFGLCVQSITDINGDGLGETLVGEPLGELPGNPTDSGAAFMFDGATGNLLWVFGSPNAEAAAQFGTFIHGVQDNDGDGRWEVLVGARLEDVGAVVDAGRAYMFRSRGF